MAENFKDINYAFNTGYNAGAKTLKQCIAVPSRNPQKYIINELLEESKNTLLDSISSDFAKIFKGAEPKCTAISVYSKRSPYVIWEIIWDIKSDEDLVYAQEFGPLFLSKEIPIMGSQCGEAFLLLATDDETSNSRDDDKNYKSILNKLKMVEINIAKRGFYIEQLIDDLPYIPYSCKELASMGLFIKHNGEIKTIDQLMKEVTQITNEQIFKGEKIQNKNQIVDGLLESIIHRIRNPTARIFRLHHRVSAAPNLTMEYSIYQDEINQKIMKVA